MSGRGRGEFHANEGTTFRCIGERHGSTMRFDNSLYDGEAEAGAAILRGEEGVHGLFESVFCKARAAVAEAYPRVTCGISAAFDKYLAFSFQCLLGVGKDIIKGAVQKVAVAKDGGFFR